MICKLIIKHRAVLVIQAEIHVLYTIFKTYYFKYMYILFPKIPAHTKLSLGNPCSPVPMCPTIFCTF